MGEPSVVNSEGLLPRIGLPIEMLTAGVGQSRVTVVVVALVAVDRLDPEQPAAPIAIVTASASNRRRRGFSEGAGICLRF